MLRREILGWLLLLLCLQLSPAFAQQRVEQLPLPKLEPPQKPIPYALRRVIQAKLDVSGESPQLICMVERYREEEREGNFVRFREVQRTRTVTLNVDGEEKQVEQAYTVRVPFTQSGLQRVLVPAGKKPVPLAWDDVKLYCLDGSQLNLQEAESQLARLRGVFLVDSLQVKIEPADEILREILRPDTLILATDKLRDPEGVPLP
ncbi:MAG: hypothetical protein NXI32_17650 [bacterium]|nr:hypothetical protein [bacterium]